MRVIECNFCGETLSAANDDELIEATRGHIEDRHADAGVDDGRLREMIDRGAYDATDS